MKQGLPHFQYLDTGIGVVSLHFQVLRHPLLTFCSWLIHQAAWTSCTEMRMSTLTFLPFAWLCDLASLKIQFGHVLFEWLVYLGYLQLKVTYICFTDMQLLMASSIILEKWWQIRMERKEEWKERKNGTR